MVCATVCLTVVPSFSDTTNVSTIGHSSKTDRSRTSLFHVAQYGDDIIGRELNLRKLPVGSENRAHKPYEQLRPIMIKTNASTESATAAYIHSMVIICCSGRICLTNCIVRRDVPAEKFVFNSGYISSFTYCIIVMSGPRKISFFILAMA